MSMMRKPTLLLNASYEALRIVPARKALTLVSKGVAVVEVPTDRECYPGIFLPSVIRLRHYRHVPVRMQQVSRKNIFTRDGFRCMYCGISGSKAGGLELEHIIPRSRGGASSWQNMVCSCHHCNQKKRDRTPAEAGMLLIHKPLPANIHTPRFLLRALGSEVTEWAKYLWHDNLGDSRFTAAA